MPLTNRYFIKLTGLLAFSVFLLNSCAKPEEPEMTFRPVRVVEAQPSMATTQRSFAGETKSALETRLSFRVGGTITRLNAEVGQRVSAGTVIAELDAQDYNVEVRRAKAAHVQAQAEAENARTDYDRSLSLYKSNNISASAFDRARTRVETTQALADAAGEQVRLAEQRLSYTRLFVPVDGFITNKTAERGEFVQPGQPVLLVATQGPLEVEALLPEGAVSSVIVGMQARVRISAISDELLQATVTEVGISPRPGDLAFPVILQLAKQVDALRPGMAARAVFEFDNASSDNDDVLVPPMVIAEDTKGRYALVVNKNIERPGGAEGIIERREVQIGALTESGIEVQRGLQTGDLVVSAGISKLIPGDAVRIAKKGPGISNIPEIESLPVPSLSDQINDR